MFFFKTKQVDSLKLLRISYLVVILAVAAFSIGCEKEVKSNLIMCNLDDYSMYPKFIEQTLPSYQIKKSENRAYYMVDDGFIVEAYDTQAFGAQTTELAQYWYPHYLATVVIAIDRDQTNTLINRWSDLSDIQEEVGFSNTPVNNKMLLAAMSYGLEGKDYTLKKAVKLLSSLHKNNLLKINSFESPVIICYDYQCAALIEAGRNIEIIVPLDGTLTYEKGLLSNEALVFEGDIENTLLQTKLRLLDGESDSSIYPDKAAYKVAIKVGDYEHFGEITSNVSPLMERKVLGVKRFVSIDSREHICFALIYMSIVTLWVVLVLRRSLQKGISYSAFFTGVILNGWALVRLIKYQVVLSDVLSRYLWYSYYIFQLSLPLLILWMAWAIDKPKDETFPPKWWRALAIFIGLLIIFVFTNDLHGLVFQLDLTRPDWAIDYTYGFGYYLVFFTCMMNITVAFAIMVKKSIKSPRKKAFILPLGVFILFGVYNYKYIVRDPFVYETDITIVTGLFVMLMFESCIRSGLIPVNTNYIDIFTRSPLKLQILNSKRKVVLASALAAPISHEIIDKAIDSSPIPILQGDESLLFANPISGGYALWSEDVRKLQSLYKEIKKSTEKLIKANAMLAEEEKIKRSINEKIEKQQLMEQLETEITNNIEKLSTMIENLKHSESIQKETTRVALLLCYIKRRCNFFFKEKEMVTMGSSELIQYLEELSEISKYGNVQIAIVNEIQEKLSIRHTTLFYDFFYSIADLAIRESCPYVIVDIGIEEDLLIMRILPSVEVGALEIELKLMDAIIGAKGRIVRKDVEDTIGISISFPKGGTEND